MFGKSKDDLPEEIRSPVSTMPHIQRPQVTQLTARAAREQESDVSSISSALTVVGKISGSGAVQVFGRVEGELQASTVLIYDGAEVEGNVVAEELTVGGRVKGTIHANRVKLNSTADVQGDIFHRSLAIEENARFEGTSRRDEGLKETPRISLARPQIVDSSRKLNGGPEQQDTPAAPAE
ncbi:MAG TPA: polymer-forming cytoskeletal protein [Xanthobacteraceae bacterium]